MEDQDLLSTSFRAIKKPWRFCPFVCFFPVKQSRRQSNIIINLFILFLVVVSDSVMCYNLQQLIVVRKLIDYHVCFLIKCYRLLRICLVYIISDVPNSHPKASL